MYNKAEGAKPNIGIVEPKIGSKAENLRVIKFVSETIDLLDVKLCGEFWQCVAMALSKIKSEGNIK